MTLLQLSLSQHLPDPCIIKSWPASLRKEYICRRYLRVYMLTKCSFPRRPCLLSQVAEKVSSRHA